MNRHLGYRTEPHRDVFDDLDEILFNLRIPVGIQNMMGIGVLVTKPEPKEVKDEDSPRSR